jgi:hypothetical protein
VFGHQSPEALLRAAWNFLVRTGEAQAAGMLDPPGLGVWDGGGGAGRVLVRIAGLVLEALGACDSGRDLSV